MGLLVILRDWALALGAIALFLTVAGVVLFRRRR